MDETKFWNILNHSSKKSSDWSLDERDTLFEQLVHLDFVNIVAFECIFRKLLYRINNYSTAIVGSIIDSGLLTSDSFLYFRCRVILHGPECYKLVLNSPDELANYNSWNSLLPAEWLLYVASDAYEEAGIRTEPNNNWSIAFSNEVNNSCKELDYDRDAVHLMGEKISWTDAPHFFPQLWKKYT